MPDPYLSRAKAAKFLGCHPNTLRRWEKTGELVPDHLTIGKHARYSHRQLRAFQKRHSTRPDDEPKIVLYARVATQDQAPDLDRQVAAMKAYCESTGQPYDEIWTEVGSGVKHRRPKLRRLIHEAIEGQLGKVIVVHPDRLSPIGDLIEDVLAWTGVELVVVEPSDTAYDPAELAEDVRAVVRDLWKQTGRPGHQGKRAGNLAAELAREFEGGDAED
jgi:predicted site-specific integrase-resolvase